MAESTASPSENPLSTRDKIFIGGLGALTPNIMNLLVVDLENIFIDVEPVAIISYLIRVVVLFYIGGVVAYLNSDENKPAKLFQLGIYAPAMILALMNATNQPPPEKFPKNNIVTEELSQNESTYSSFIASIEAGIFGATALAQNAPKQPIPVTPQDTGDLRVGAGHMMLLKDPALRTWYESDSSIVSVLDRGVDSIYKKIDTIQLRDKQLHQFSYPKETITEQVLRGFLGWRSDRLYYVVLSEHPTMGQAVAQAKLVTKEMNDRSLKEVADWQGQKLIPRVFQPYGVSQPKYTVVIAQHLNLAQAEAIRAKIERKKFNSISSGDIKLWRLPF